MTIDIKHYSHDPKHDEQAKAIRRVKKHSSQTMIVAPQILEKLVTEESGYIDFLPPPPNGKGQTLKVNHRVRNHPHVHIKSWLKKSKKRSSKYVCGIKTRGS